MRLTMKNRRNGSILTSIHHKLWLIICSVFLILLFTLGLQQLRQFKINYWEQQYNRINNIEITLNNLISITEGFSSAMVCDDDLQAMLNRPSENYYNEWINYRSVISKYILPTECIDAVFVKNTNGRTFESFGVTSFNDQDILPETVEKKEWTAVPGSAYKSEKINSPVILALIKPVYYFLSGRRIGTMEVCINSGVLNKIFPEENVKNATKVEYYLINSNNIVIASSNVEKIGKEEDLELPTVLFEEASYGNKYILNRYCENINCCIRCSFERSDITNGLLYEVAGIAILAAILIIASYYISQFSAKRISANICELTKQVEEIGKSRTSVEISSSDEVGILAEAFNDLIAKLHSESENLVTEQKMKRWYQVELIQQQINPHFLYNTLENISSLVQLHEEKIVTNLINHLAKFYREVLSKGETIIPLSKEISITKSYLDIMMIRNHNNFTYSFEIPKELEERKCLKLTLQPIVENCITHAFWGIKNKSDNRIEISAEQQNSTIRIFVKDNGKGIPKYEIEKIISNSEAHEKSFGLLGIHRRLQLYAGPNYGIEVSDAEGGGTIVCVKIPADYDEINNHFII